MRDNTTHRVFWCASCGLTHNETKRKVVLESGKQVVKTLCEKCRGDDWKVVCWNCGETDGHNLYPTPLINCYYDSSSDNLEYKTCSVIVPLCEKCNLQVITKHTLGRELEVEEICHKCPQRFECQTSRQDKLHYAKKST